MDTNEIENNVMDGKKRHIPNMDTFNNLFINTSGILCSTGIVGSVWKAVVEAIEEEEPMTNGAQLIKADNSKTVYLLTNRKKYGIDIERTFEACFFSRGKIKTYPAIIVDAIEDGKLHVLEPKE